MPSRIAESISRRMRTSYTERCAGNPGSKEDVRRVGLCYSACRSGCIYHRTDACLVERFEMTTCPGSGLVSSILTRLHSTWGSVEMQYNQRRERRVCTPRAHGKRYWFEVLGRLNVMSKMDRLTHKTMSRACWWTTGRGRGDKEQFVPMYPMPFIATTNIVPRKTVHRTNSVTKGSPRSRGSRSTATNDALCQRPSLERTRQHKKKERESTCQTSSSTRPRQPTRSQKTPDAG